MYNGSEYAVETVGIFKIALVEQDELTAGEVGYIIAGIKTVSDVRVGDKYGFIDKTGKFVIEPRFDFADSFSGGLAAIRVGDEATGKYGYIDLQGTMVIEPQFAFADLFSASDGLAAVRTGTGANSKYGYIAR